MKKFGASLTDAQVRLARRIEQAGLASYSQAVKAFERQETARIEGWKKQLADKQK